MDSGHAPGSAVSAVDARAHELRACATRRWLVKDELVFLLLHHRQQTAVSCLRKLYPRPPSGTLLFYDTTEVADFKKDGWRWQKRKDNSGRVREDRAKLVINREVIILGTYVHSSEIPTFHRRNYYLRDSNQHVMLVHYFDEVHKIDPSMGALVPAKSQLLPRVSPSNLRPPSGTRQPPITTMNRTLVSNRSEPSPTPSEASPTLFKTDPNDEANHSDDVIMDDSFSMDFHGRGLHLGRDDNLASNTSIPAFDDDDALLTELSSLLSPVSSSSHHESMPSRATPPSVVEISDFSPGWDFVQGGAKILLCLAAPLPSSDVGVDGEIFVQFGAHARSAAERISDTVLRCAAPRAVSAGQVELLVCRCSSATSADCIPISSKAQFEYRSAIPSPAPTPLIENEADAFQLNALPDFHVNAYSTISAGKRGRSPGPGPRLIRQSLSGSKPTEGRRWSNPDCSNLSAFVDTDLDERQCKIRVVERLAEFQDAIRTTSTTTIQNGCAAIQSVMATDQSAPFDRGERGAIPPSDNEKQPSIVSASIDDRTIEALSDRDLESLSEQLIENVVRQLVTVAHTSEELLDELNSLDETGLSLLHYVSFYNYSHLIPLLLTHGAQVNQQSTQGQTPLHLAAGCGHEQVVTNLLEAGAEVFALDFDGFTPAERAEKSGHFDVAQRLLACMGASTVVQGSLEAEWAGDGLWDGSMEGMDIDSDAGGFSSLQSSQERLAPTPESVSADSDVDSGIDLAAHAPRSAPRVTSYVGENQEHNRKLLLGAFSTMSLRDKCALSLSVSRDLASTSTNVRRRGSSISEDSVAALMTAGSSSASSPSKGTELSSINTANNSVGGDNETLRDTDVKSVIADDEENMNKLEAAMELMGPEEIQSLEEEARVIQHNVRAWLLRRNCRNMREATKRLHEAAKSIENQQKKQEEQHLQSVDRHSLSQQKMSQRERAAVTVQAAARSMLARKSFLQTRNVTIKVQAATRGVLCRKNFARMKTHALASLVIQRNVREWLSKHPNSINERALSVAVSGNEVGQEVSPAPIVTHPQDKSAVDEDDASIVRELDAALETPSMTSPMMP